MKPQRSKRWLLKISLCALVLLVGALPFTPAHDYQRAASLLLRMNDPGHPTRLSEFGVYPVDESILTIETPSGSLRARLYSPQGVAQPSSIVLAPSIHHVRIDD